eukprot:3598507-Prorocentrum_lima.AAC.1
MFNARLAGTQGPLEAGTQVDWRAPGPRPAGERWLGPCTVLGMEGNKVVWIRTPAGKAVSAHRHTLQPSARNGIVQIKATESNP